MKVSGNVLVLLLAAAAIAGVKAQYQLLPLPYPYEALEPVIDRQTNIFHHDVDQKRYVESLNAALQGQNALQGLPLTELVGRVGTGSLPQNVDVAVRFNGGGDWNHVLYFKIMAPPGSANTSVANISPSLQAAINRGFGSTDNMIAKVSDIAVNHLGSGWAWLCAYPDGSLDALDTMNQDNPLMGAVQSEAPNLNRQGAIIKPPTRTGETCVPILGIDVWEHAYFLKYGPNRAAYVLAWWSLVNWRQVSANYDAAKTKQFDVISTNV